MPFRSIADDSALMPHDLDFLQSVYEEAVAEIPNVDDVTMHNVVHTLIMRYRAGETDRDSLISAAALSLGRKAG